ISSYHQTLFIKYFQFISLLKIRIKMMFKNPKHLFPPIYQDPYPPQFEKDVEYTFSLIKDLDQSVRADHGRLLVLHVPYGIEVDPQELVNKGYDIPWSQNLFDKN